jgi:N6-adenosine-specific RNA methylase IME4
MNNEIIEHSDMLPATVEELIDFVIVGNEAVKAWKNKVRAINKVELANEAHKQSLKDGQKLGELVLLAEAKLGELLSKRERPYVKDTEGSFKGTFRDLPVGIDKKESHYAQEIYRHPTIMHQTIAEIIDKHDIPTRHNILKAIQKYKKDNQPPTETPPLPKGKYNVIYADPPWEIGSIELEKWESPLNDKYNTMTLEEIKELNVPKLAFEDCSLFLWTTHTFLEKAFEVINSWGFKYHCCITWDKGSGWSANGFHRRTEFCLYAYKGKMNVNQEGDFIPTLIVEKKGKHSEKPKIMRNWIISNSPKPRIELFAREKIDDEFDVWGDEVDGKEE